MRAATIGGSAEVEGETSLYTVRVRGLKGAVVVGTSSVGRRVGGAGPGTQL